MITIDLLFFSLFEGVFFVIFSCLLAIKLTNLITGQTDNDLVWGLFLFGQSSVINFILVFLIYSNLNSWGIALAGFELFDYLSSSYCEMVAIISLLLLPIVSTLITKARID